jgi:uncharacterized repeat protein (TIGR01451 family)
VETYTLAVDSSLAGDSFDPIFENIIYLDDGDGLFDPARDARYVAGANDPTLDANDPATDSVIVFVLNSIPAGVSEGDTGNSKLTAASATGGGQPGTVFVGLGDNGTNAVIGLSGGQDDDTGSYAAKQLAVRPVKSVAVSHPDYPVLQEAIPGSILIYTIAVTAEGTGTAENVVVTDRIPAGTTYQPGSLTLNGAALTDAAGDDAGDVGASTANTVTVALPDLTALSAPQIVTFTVVIDN